MVDDLREALERLEHEGWDALCAGTASDFYGRLMTSDGAMVVADGRALTRSEAVTALRGAPRWDGYTITDVRLVTTGQDSGALLYRGTGRRDGEPDFVALMSSVYTRVDGRWRLALYTQTPVPGST